MNYADTIAVIVGHIKESFTSLPLYADNNYQFNREVTGYVQIRHEFGEEKASGGSTHSMAFDSFNHLVLEIVTQKGNGEGLAINTADQLAEIFRGQSIQGLNFLGTELETERSPPDGMHQLNLWILFEKQSHT